MNLVTNETIPYVLCNLSIFSILISEKNTPSDPQSVIYLPFQAIVFISRGT